MKERTLTEQIVVRVTPAQHKWLADVSEEEGRTIAQTIRLLVKINMDRGMYR